MGNNKTGQRGTQNIQKEKDIEENFWTGSGSGWMEN